jgi:GT2 family glycosyltransferase
LKNAEKFFNEYNVDVVGGPQLTPNNDGYFAKTSGYAMGSFLGTHKMSNRYKKGKLNLDADEYCLASANLFVKKNVFNSTAGFDPKLYPGEDSELIKRLKSLGFKVAYNPSLVIYHKRRSTFRSFFRQFFNYGKVCLQKEKTRSMKPSLLYFLPTLFLFYLISLIFLYKTNLLFLVPLGFYVILVLLNSFYLSIKNRDILSLPLLPFIFLSIHLAYGLGIVVGLIKRIT